MQEVLNLNVWEIKVDKHYENIFYYMHKIFEGFGDQQVTKVYCMLYPQHTNYRDCICMLYGGYILQHFKHNTFHIKPH